MNVVWIVEFFVIGVRFNSEKGWDMLFFNLVYWIYFVWCIIEVVWYCVVFNVFDIDICFVSVMFIWMFIKCFIVVNLVIGINCLLIVDVLVLVWESVCNVEYL